MKWEIDNKVISKLFVQGKNIIEPWGIETADSSAFFSLEDGFGYRYKLLEENYAFDEKKYSAHIVNQMHEGQWQLDISDAIITGSQITRLAELTTFQDSFFMDFVMRFRFKKEFIKYAQISTDTFYHKNTNIYYQYPVDRVFLKGVDFDIQISVVDSLVPAGMTPTMYIRDSGSEWVVHVRMIPNQFDKKVIKICTAWAGTRPLPQQWSDYLLGFEKLHKALWYRGERFPYRNRLLKKILNPSAFGLVKIEKGNTLMWNVKIEIA